MSKDSYEYLDIEVIKRFKQGDQDAFDEIYNRYYKNIYYLGFHYFHDEEKAKDIVQETFMNICKYINRLESEEAFFIWMNRIAYNCCNDLYRKVKKDASYYKDENEGEFLEQSMTFSYNIDYGGDMEKSRAKQVIISSLEKMSEELRVVGYLCFFEELSYKEIAEVSDIPLGTVKSRVNRIKKRLKIELEKNNISSEGCFSILLIPNINNIYTEYIQTIPLADNNQFVFQDEGKTVFKVEPPVKHVTMSKIFILLSIITLPIASIVYEKEIRENIFQQDTLAKIKNIEYDDKLTRDSVTIKVNTTNDRYDNIHLNGSSKLSVKQNGVYLIELLKTGKVIDSKILDIKNIDKDSPITNEVIQEKYVELHISDNYGIDFQKIEVIENGIKVKDYLIDQAEGVMYFFKDITKKSIVKIPDLVGNVSKVEISFKEVNK